MSPANETAPSGPAEAVGDFGNAAWDTGAKAVNGTVTGLVRAGEAAAGGIATAAEQVGSWLTELVPFSIDLAVVLL